MKLASVALQNYEKGQYVLPVEQAQQLAELLKSKLQFCRAKIAEAQVLQAGHAAIPQNNQMQIPTQVIGPDPSQIQTQPLKQLVIPPGRARGTNRVAPSPQIPAGTGQQAGQQDGANGTGTPFVPPVNVASMPSLLQARRQSVFGIGNPMTLANTSVPVTSIEPSPPAPSTVLHQNFAPGVNASAPGIQQPSPTTAIVPQASLQASSLLAADGLPVVETAIVPKQETDDLQFPGFEWMDEYVSFDEDAKFKIAEERDVISHEEAARLRNGMLNQIFLGFFIFCLFLIIWMLWPY